MTTSWSIGDITVTAIVEMDLPVPFAGLLPTATADVVAQEPWLIPHWALDHDHMHVRFQALVIESVDRRVVVDTCIGNGKSRPGFDFFDGLESDFLADLRTAGFDPETIDVVTCTHLHMDHVGWNTRWINDTWVPTFPAARYLFSRIEYEHWRRERDEEQMHARPFHDSVEPVIDAGLVDLVDPPCELAPGVRLVPTVGHTPGHCSVEITSQGERAVITGDLAHNPIQLARPEIASSADSDQAGSTATRRAFIAETVGTDTLVIGTHFGAPSAGRLREVDGRVRLVADTA